LKIHIRHDDEGDRHGLFVHGFRPGSLAEGILQVGDELLEVNGVDVKSKYLEDFLNIIREIEHHSISFKVRRNNLNKDFYSGFLMNFAMYDRAPSPYYHSNISPFSVESPIPSQVDSFDNILIDTSKTIDNKIDDYNTFNLLNKFEDDLKLP
jgi:hypothetical protein